MRWLEPLDDLRPLENDSDDTAFAWRPSDDRGQPRRVRLRKVAASAGLDRRPASPAARGRIRDLLAGGRLAEDAAELDAGDLGSDGGGQMAEVLGHPLRALARSVEDRPTPSIYRS